LISNAESVHRSHAVSFAVHKVLLKLMDFALSFATVSGKPNRYVELRQPFLATPIVNSDVNF
jgi:hypothetical protein